jgi:hypothetical protein
MSLTVTNPKSERQQIVDLRRQAVFAFISSHLDAEGHFSESDQYIANVIAGSDRKSVNRARQSLEQSGDCMIVEKDRRDAGGKPLPNKVRPVPSKTFWVREWIRQGSKAETRVHGENGISRPQVNPSKEAGLKQKTSAPVSTVKTRGHDHKNSTQRTESPFSISEGLHSTAYSTHCCVHGVFDPPVRRALAALQRQLADVKSRLMIYSENATGGPPEQLRAELRDIEGRIATLEGR